MAPQEEHELAEYNGNKKSSLSIPENDAQDNEEEVVNKHASQYLSIKIHWGLPRAAEVIIFYNLAILGWLCLIAAAVIASYKRTRSKPFIATITAAFVFHWAAWFQTAFAMVQRASWRREETLVERVQFLFFAIRLQRLMIPTALVTLITFIQAYVRRDEYHDLAYWLIFLLMFIVNTVFSVMNAYNNITWEADRLYYDDNMDGIPKVIYALLGV